jgi:hypothetical protein
MCIKRLWVSLHAAAPAGVPADSRAYKCQLNISPSTTAADCLRYVCPPPSPPPPPRPACR